MVKLNKSINWKPESTGTGRFGNWLENANDWNLSRSRFWGIPIPIWRSEDGKDVLCIGSVEELVTAIEESISAGFMTENPFADFVVGNMEEENYDSTLGSEEEARDTTSILYIPYIELLVQIAKDYGEETELYNEVENAIVFNKEYDDI